VLGVFAASPGVDVRRVRDKSLQVVVDDGSTLVDVEPRGGHCRGPVNLQLLAHVCWSRHDECGLTVLDGPFVVRNALFKVTSLMVAVVLRVANPNLDETA